MTQPPPEPGATVTVRAMTPAEFEGWKERSISSHAADVAHAKGLALESALRGARQQFAELMPAGPDTENVWLLVVVDARGTDVGTIWIGPHPEIPDAAYVFDIEIAADQRGRGLGRAAMVAAERVVGEAGITEIGLNVFGFNERARRLYDSLGYRVIATQMTKQIKS